MKIDIKLLKQLRRETGVSITECNKALIEAVGDIEIAKSKLRTKGLKLMQSDRVVNQGVINSYIHQNHTIGVILELGCETDFTAKNKQFLNLHKNISLQIAAREPKYIAIKDVPISIVENFKYDYINDLRQQGKPEHIIKQIVTGKLNRFYREQCLLEQPFIKDETITIGEMIADCSLKMNENIKIKRFVHFRLERETIICENL